MGCREIILELSKLRGRSEIESTRQSSAELPFTLHGVRRATIDLDLYTPDRRHTADQLEASGARWDLESREHVLNGVRIHTVTPDDAKHTVERTSIIDGVRVVSLKDLIAIKLICGLNNLGRAKDLGDVQELIRVVPLDKRFAGKLPEGSAGLSRGSLMRSARISDPRARIAFSSEDTACETPNP